MTTPEPTAPIFDLDPELLGTMLLRLLAVAVRVGHANITSTFAYAAADQGGGREVEFLWDALNLKAHEVAEKWYGDRHSAARFAAEVFGEALAPHRKTPAA